ncbi:MAG: hypothetical protein ACPL4E_09570, partial [Thermoproteota archaeon]
STLEWLSKMDKEFLSQHAGNLMEYLGSPLLRFKLNSLLGLSPEEALSLSQNVGGDFQQMLRLAEFRQAFEQFSKLGPDIAGILSISGNGIEVGVEESLAVKLYPNIQRGTVVEFEFAKGSIVLKGLLAYAGERTLGESDYMVFEFKAEERIPAVFELLKEDLQSVKVVPGQQAEKTFGFNAFSLSDGKLSMDKGSLSMDGSVRFGDGMVLRLEDPSIRLVPSENPFETGELNKMLLGGRISGTSILIGEDGGVKAFYGGSYLPAVVTASTLGLQLGLLAKPSGETLTITQMDLAQRGVADSGLLNIVYPSGETSTIIYTGKDLQTPLFSYSSGAFVGIQAVETRVVWTGVDRKAFYTQIASVSELLAGILGTGFKEELVKTVLLSGLTDSQALDVVNTLAKNVEWIKTLSGKGRVEAVRKITDYVKKGETAEEAAKRVKGESEEYVKTLELEIAGFCSSISDTMLANEVEDFLRHVLNTLGPDGAKWLLNLLRNVYYGALTQSHGNSEFANDKLRSVVEKVFKYPESKSHGCRLTSVKTLQLMSLEEETLRRILEESLSSEGEEIVVDRFEKTIPESGRVRGREKLEKGLYLVRVTRKEDGKVFEWSSRKDEDSDVFNTWVPERFLKELAGKEVEIAIVKYDYSLHFKSKGSNLYFSPGEGLTVEGKEIELERVEPQSWSERHGASMMVKLAERSTYGAEIYLMFFEDGDFGVLFGEYTDKGARNVALSVEGNLLIIEYEGHKSIVPIVVQEWKEGEKYYLNIPLEERGRIRLVEELRKIFGYYNVEELRKKIGEGELMLVAYFDNGRRAFCGTGRLEINVPEGAETLKYVEILSRPEFSCSENLSDEKVEEIKKASKAMVGKYGRDVAKAYVQDGQIAEIGKAEFIRKEVKIKVVDERVDLVFKTEDNRLIIVEVKSSKTSEKELAGHIVEGLEQLESYKNHIQEYGLDLTEEGLGIEKGENIKAYIVVYVYFDLGNKEVKVGYERLSSS